MDKQKSWFKKHWILTTLFIILGIFILLGIIGGITSNKNTQKEGDKSNSTVIIINDSEANISLQIKTSGFTLSDCLDECDKYCLQMQTSVCQGGCYNIGKPGKALDEWVLGVRDATSDLSC